jgi:hypothetical protein
MERDVVPLQRGDHIGSTPLLEQSRLLANNAERCRDALFMQDVGASSRQVVRLRRNKVFHIHQYSRIHFRFPFILDFIFSNLILSPPIPDSPGSRSR